jgi:2-polyprenyl-3-methyl-5-hydroxy-6-metoxy-1,4-benzoquinol methylase
MSEYDASTYGEHIADVYDAWPTVPANAAAIVERLAALADRGPVLELGIGTGRIALPLAARGLDVHGIDASPAMVAKLRAKPGGGTASPSRWATSARWTLPATSR